MRLLDRILSEGFNSVKPDEDVEQVQRKLEASQLVVIDNVADYTWGILNYERKVNEIGDLIKVSDFPNVMLPFEQAFLEMRTPRFLQVEECGVLMEMTKADALNLGELNESLDRALQIFRNGEAVYVLICSVFLYRRDFQKATEVARFMLPVDAEGQIVPLDDKFPVIGKVYARTEESKVDEHVGALMFLYLYLYPCFLALSFMHCRNVKVRTEQPPPKLSKKFQKKSGRPLLKYRVLMIDHVKQVLESEGKAVQKA